MSPSRAKIHTVVIPETLSGSRLDKALATLIADLSRTRLKALMQAGFLTKDGRPATDPALKVFGGEKFQIIEPPAEEASPAPEDIPLVILFEDQDLIVINKPAGLVVHPGAGNARGTLVNALLHHAGDSLSGIGGVRRPGIVHRLDKETSGVMVVAKNDKAHQKLSKQFSKHSLTRKYLAIVPGTPNPPEGVIETLIARHPVNRKKMAVSPTRGKAAVTHYRVVKTLPWASVVECTLETGRTHQVRVHMAHIGHPLFGDPLYSRGRIPKALKGSAAEAAIKAFPRQALHAYHLSFQHPVSGETKTFETPLPSDMQALISAFSGEKNRKNLKTISD